MICKELISKIEQDFPAHYALEWDNVGLLIGREGKEVKRIYLALDADDAVIEAALKEEADLLITHHPFIFTPLHKVTDEEFIGRRIMRMLQSDLSYYALHTNYDVLRMGSLCGERLGLKNTTILSATQAEDPSVGIGQVGELDQAITLAECCQLVKGRFHLDSVRLFGEPQQLVQRLAVAPGSGKGMIEAALEQRAQVLITGDVDHHAGIDACAQQLAVIDPGHYGLEHVFVKDMNDYIRKTFPKIQVIGAKTIQPFQVV